MAALASRAAIGLVSIGFVSSCDGTAPLAAQIELGEATSDGADGGLRPEAQGLDRRPDAEPYLGFPPVPVLGTSGWSTTDAFPNLEFDTPVFLAEAPTTSHLFVAEREGRLWAFVNDPGATDKKLVLDLSSHTQGFNDSGLLGFAFHPEFGTSSVNGRFIYLHYAHNPTPAPKAELDLAPPTTPTESRLSRFSVDLETLSIDPASELVLIAQPDRDLWHQGGALFFHPHDGFLYLSVGDEGSGGCYFDNCQRIDKNLFGGVLRIDVDRIGGVVSHPVPRGPVAGSSAHYYIPNDNPFVGEPGVLEEFYALGLRSPHRMTHDPVDDVTFIGDVGQNTHEEVNVLKKAANFQWQVNEGNALYTDGPGALPDTIGEWTSPVLQFDRTEARSIIGGYVYRGERLPELRGKYIYGDFVYGNIWALDFDVDEGNVTILSNDLLAATGLRGVERGITSFGVDARGELYLLTMGSRARIQRLRKGMEGMNNVPATLGSTGLFVDLASLTPASALIPYDVNVPLWSDGADKRRWLSVPAKRTVGFDAEGAWQFPEGSLFVKHFEVALDERQPGVRRPLETRVLVKGADQSLYGVTYKWRADGTEADLLVESQVEDLEITRFDGTIEKQRYFYPGPHDCMTCHNAAVGGILGVNARQMNRTSYYESTGRLAHQLTSWQRIGLFAPRSDWRRVDEYPRLVSSPGGESDEAYLRSYWDVNCGMCHGASVDIKSEWDARYVTPLEQQGIIGGKLIGGTMAEDAFVIAPGAPERSALYLRDATTDRNQRMPPLGSNVPDRGYLEVLERWILSLESSPPTEP